MSRLRPLIAFALLAFIACGTSSSTLGPLTIDPPDGWFVSDRQLGTIKVTNGTVGEGTESRRGTATAVFDVYIDSGQSLREYRNVLEDNNVESDEETIRIDSYDAVIVTSHDSAFAPPSQTVFIPDWDVRIVYRAAFGNSKAAFERNKAAFGEALRSITFSGRPPA
jgi:hypothetical protein